jgi:RNA polymerase sigma-70 factor, ECF subfamily
MQMSQPSPLDLISKARKGDAEAAGMLYERYYQNIYSYLFYHTGDIQTAEDLTGEVFLKMVQALPNYSESNGLFLAWLLRIARNLSIDHYRRFNQHPEVELMDEIIRSDLEVDQVVESNLTIARLQKVLANVKEDQREVLLLRFIEGLSISDVANLLVKSEDAIKGLQRRGLMSVQMLLRQLEVGDEPS